MKIGNIIFLKRCYIKIYNGTYSLIVQGAKIFDPEIPEKEQLLAWYAKFDNKTEFAPSAFAAYKRCNIIDLKNVTAADGNNIYCVVGSINCIARRENMWYKSNPDINATIGKYKKVIYDAEKNKFFCEDNGKYYDTYTNRYKATIQIMDFTGAIFAMAFDDVSKKILGKTADEMELMAKNAKKQYEAVFNNIYLAQNYVFKLRFKSTVDTTNEMFHLQCRIIDCKKYEPAEEIPLLAIALKQIKNK